MNENFDANRAFLADHLIKAASSSMKEATIKASALLVAILLFFGFNVLNMPSIPTSFTAVIDLFRPFSMANLGTIITLVAYVCLILAIIFLANSLSLSFNRLSAYITYDNHGRDPDPEKLARDIVRASKRKQRAYRLGAFFAILYFILWIILIVRF